MTENNNPKVDLISSPNNALKIIYTACRVCYSAEYPIHIWDKSTDYEKMIKLVKKILESGHHSTIEHCQFVFSISGVSRACTHQLVRHRHMSFCQKSQRYVTEKEQFEYVVPPTIKDQELLNEYNEFMGKISDFYAKMIEKGIPAEDARFILPNAATSSMIASLNLRELIHLANLRLCTNCYDENTEVLTNNGWKFFKDIKEDDLFYSLNLENNKCELVKSKNIIKSNYSGDMIRVKSQSIDLLVTPNHKNVVSYSYENKNFILDEAENNNNHKMILMKKNCSPITGSQEEDVFVPDVETEDRNQYTSWDKVVPGRYVKTADLLLFLGFYISDGCVCKSGDHYNVIVSKGDYNIIQKYKNIIQRLTPNKVEISQSKTCYNIIFHDRVLYEFLKPIGKAKDKHIPKWVWKYDYTLLEKLFEGLCDGDMKKDQLNSYSTISKKLVDDIQRLLLHIGLSGTVSEINRIGKTSSGLDKNNNPYEITSKNIEYRCSVNRFKNEPMIKTTNRNALSKEKYSGKIYCVELYKYHTLYIRRNNKTVWSGNSQHEIRKVVKKMCDLTVKKEPWLSEYLVPKCDAKGYCDEIKSCGRMAKKRINV